MKVHVVVSISIKKTQPNKGSINKATICPIVRFTDTEVTYNSNSQQIIKLIFSSLSSQHRIEGWNYDNKSLGFFMVDRLELDQPGIIKG